MLFDEFDRGVVILGDTDDSHVGVGRQRPVNAVPHQQGILGDDDRNATTHLDAVLSPVAHDHSITIAAGSRQC